MINTSFFIDFSTKPLEKSLFPPTFPHFWAFSTQYFHKFHNTKFEGKKVLFIVEGHSTDTALKKDKMKERASRRSERRRRLETQRRECERRRDGQRINGREAIRLDHGCTLCMSHVLRERGMRDHMEMREC